MMNKVLLLILDGWGLGENDVHNPIAVAQPSYWNKLWSSYPHCIIDAKEASVGLPPGCLSGSEVGHLTIGSGRVLSQGAARINQSIQDGTFRSNDVLTQAVTHVRTHHGKLHFVGLLSDGGIHSHISHMVALQQWAKDAGLLNVHWHLFLDGRDMAQKSAADLLQTTFLPSLPEGQSIATLCGRAIAMDRSENWERTEQIFQLLTNDSLDITDTSPEDVIRNMYQEEITDEFVPPTRFTRGTISNHDAVVFFNFRPDRMRQLVRLFTGRAPHAVQQNIQVPEDIFLASMTEYDAEYREVHVMFGVEYPVNTLGEWLSKQGLRQFRIAETEKYAHITYFLNGGQEEPFDGEERLVIPSYGLTSYASKPEMSLPELSLSLCRVLGQGEHHFIVCNIANGDMVGHSGNFDACVQAVSEVDQALSTIVSTATDAGYVVLLTADHGNIEKMKEKDEPHTAHTFNDVPLVLVGYDGVVPERGYLYQIAPTILKPLDLPQPPEMTGTSLLP